MRLRITFVRSRPVRVKGKSVAKRLQVLLPLWLPLGG